MIVYNFPRHNTTCANNIHANSFDDDNAYDICNNANMLNMLNICLLDWQKIAKQITSNASHLHTPTSQTVK